MVTPLQPNISTTTQTTITTTTKKKKKEEEKTKAKKEEKKKKTGKKKKWNKKGEHLYIEGSSFVRIRFGIQFRVVSVIYHSHSREVGLPL
jgi:hypothetical protein